jgi:hypothetical protein
VDTAPPDVFGRVSRMVGAFAHPTLLPALDAVGPDAVGVAE